MTDLPPGWEWSTFGEIAELSLGRMLDKKRETGGHLTRYLRNTNVRWGGFDLADVALMDIPPEQLDRVQAQAGDLIACEGGEPGRCAVWSSAEPIALQKALHRIRPYSGVVPEFLMHWLAQMAFSRQLKEHFTGTTIKHLPKERLMVVPVPLPPTAEQERIVAAIEEYLSRLDAAKAGLRTASARADQWERSLLSFAQAEGEERSLAELIDAIEAGKSFNTPGRAAGPDEWGVIKVSAMTWGNFREGENKAVPSIQPIDSRHEIRPGDLLLSRANTSQYVGAAVLVESTRPRLLLSDKSLRLLPKPGVDRRWLRFALGAPSIRSQMSVLATGTSDSMRNISQAKLRALRLRVPSLDRQAEVAGQIARALDGGRRFAEDIARAARRADVLQGSVLSAAFSGRLVPQDPSDEPVSVLLERIKAERAHGPKKQTRKAKAS